MPFETYGTIRFFEDFMALQKLYCTLMRSMIIPIIFTLFQLIVEFVREILTFSLAYFDHWCDFLKEIFIKIWKIFFCK